MKTISKHVDNHVNKTKNHFYNKLKIHRIFTLGN